MKSIATKQLLAFAERILIVSIFASILIYYVYTGNSDIQGTSVYLFVRLVQILLIGYYAYTVRFQKIYLFAGYAILCVAILFASKLSVDYFTYLHKLGLLGLIGTGIYFSIKTFRESITYKDVELFGILLCAGFFYPFIHFSFLATEKELIIVYYFVFAFVLGTILYNENLWDKYSASEKKLLTFSLVFTLTEVILVSLKLL